MSRALTIGRGLALALLVTGQSCALGSAQSGRAARSTTATGSVTTADRAALMRALTAYDHGQPDEARPVLEELVRRYPGSFEATETLGLIDAEGGNSSAGLSLLQKACVLRPASALAQANLGTAYLKLNRVEDAVRALKRAAALDRRNRDTQSALAQALMRAGRPAEAAAAFAAANAVGSPDSDLLYNWAVTLLAAGKPKQAGEVLARTPQKELSAQAQSLWGDIEEKNGNYGAALQHDQLAAQLDASETNLYALGLELARDSDFPAAVKVFDYGVAKYPQSVSVRLGLGIAKYGNDDYRGSAQIFSPLLQQDPENNLYAELLGRDCIMIEKEQNASCEVLERTAADHPSNAAADLYVAEGDLRLPAAEQDTTRAKKLLDQAIAANPKLEDAYFQMGVLDQQQLLWQESAAMLEKAIALRPNDAQAHYRLARGYAHIGKRDAALREIALQQKYSDQSDNSQTARVREVTTFLAQSH